jgi:hypothetical protein
MVWTVTQLGLIGPYFFEEEGVTVTVNSEHYVAMLRPEWKRLLKKRDWGMCGSNRTELQLTQLEIQ